MRSSILALSLVGALAACRPSPADQVVFVCEHGAPKSVVAAAYFNKLAAERGLRARAIARGAAPQESLAKSAVRGLGGDGIAAGLEAPRALHRGRPDCDQAAMKGLLGMGACWGDVPATGEDYAHARDVIRAHLEVADRLRRRHSLWWTWAIALPLDEKRARGDRVSPLDESDPQCALRAAVRRALADCGRRGSAARPTG